MHRQYHANCDCRGDVGRTPAARPFSDCAPRKAFIRRSLGNRWTSPTSARNAEVVSGVIPERDGAERGRGDGLPGRGALRERHPASTSRGQKQRVCAARVDEAAGAGCS